MKAEILCLLKETKGYLSGQELSRHFQVSRTAIWKAIEQLKKSGYEIEAVRNKGYHLVSIPKVLTREELLSYLGEGSPLVYEKEVDSTNQRGRLLGETKSPDGTLIVADRQTGGKGRRGRDWESPADENIYMSVLCYPDMMPDKAPQLTLLMALAVVKGIKEVTGITPEIKWPNDIVLNGKKVCGILTEMSAQADYINYVVIGAGINVNQKEFSKELKHKATSIYLETGEEYNRSLLIGRISDEFKVYYKRFLKEQSLHSFKEEYNALLISREKEVVVMDPKGTFCAYGLGINDRGELKVRLPDGSVKEIYAGEVSIRGVNGYV